MLQISLRGPIPEPFADLSGNRSDVSTFTDWIESNFVEGGRSMIALPDTQVLL
jgi:hypothetical protein